MGLVTEFTIIEKSISRYESIAEKSKGNISINLWTTRIKSKKGGETTLVP